MPNHIYITNTINKNQNRYNFHTKYPKVTTSKIKAD